MAEQGPLSLFLGQTGVMVVWKSCGEKWDRAGKLIKFDEELIALEREMADKKIIYIIPRKNMEMCYREEPK